MGIRIGGKIKGHLTFLYLLENTKNAGSTDKVPRARVRGYERLRGKQRSTEKGGVTEVIQSVEECGRREQGNNFGVIFQGLLFQKKFKEHIFGVIWGSKSKKKIFVSRLLN